MIFFFFVLFGMHTQSPIVMQSVSHITADRLHAQLINSMAGLRAQFYHVSVVFDKQAQCQCAV